MSRSSGYATEAIVVRTIDFAETSQVVHLATPEHGLVHAIAKGARSVKGSFEGGLSIATLGEADVLPRRSAELDLLRSFRMTDGLRGLRADLARFHAAEYVVGLLRTILRPALPAPSVFAAGVATLRALAHAAPEAVPLWVVVFEARALAASGHRPHLSSCVACGGAVDGRVRFDPALGGIVHARCASGPRTLALSPSDRGALERLYTARLPQFVSEPPSPRDVAAARAVHDLFLPYVLEREPAASRGLRR